AALLSGSFGLLAFGLVAVGLYGVMASVVNQRTKEIGVRIALGAPPARVQRQFVGDGLRVVAIGLGIGLVLTIASSHVLTLALGIGANTAIFSVVNAVLLRPPPFKEPGRLVFVSEKSKDMDNMSVSYPNFLDWQRQQAGFSSLAAFRTEEWNLIGTSQP